MRFMLKFSKHLIKVLLLNVNDIIFGHLPLSFDIDLKRMNFLHKLLLMEQSPAHLMLKLIAGNDLTLLCNKYNIKIEASWFKRKEAVWGAFSLSLQQ